MSRPLRIQFPGAWYHVMNRGMARRSIFDNAEHYNIFIELLGEIHKRFGVQTHAYCLMGNHYHLLLHTPHGNLSRAMRHVDGVYTQKFNRLQKRDGPLFRGRYKSILIDADSYLLQLSRYIHLNPLSAKLVVHAEEYLWSSYRAYLKIDEAPEWLCRDDVLSQCSRNLSIKRYRNFVAQEAEDNISSLLLKPHLPSILGDVVFVDKIKAKQGPPLVPHHEIPESKKLLAEPKKDIRALINIIANYYRIKPARLRARGSRYEENRGRNVMIYLFSSYYGYNHQEISQTLGNISYAGVAKVKERMGALINRDAVRKKEVEELMRQISMSNVKT